MTGLVLDLFAGPGGWDEGAKTLGLRPVGIEWDMAACQTAMAAGHTRVRADVEQLPTEPMVGKVWGLIASPPCQDFSLAGKQAGITGEKGRLIAQVLRWTGELRPRWVACEQVPPCLPVWREYAQVMRGWGYRTWVGVLNAADYGVPQTRKRAILLASLDRQPCRPEPTHAKGGALDLFGERLPWVSMAQALGWRQKLIERVYVNGPQQNAAVRPATEPAPTVHFGHQSNDVRWAVVRGQSEPAHTCRSTNGMLVGRQLPPGESQAVGGWAWDRPATTVVGSFSPDVIAAAPGYRTSVSRQNAEGSVRVTVAEGGVLQSFPPDYPWQGSRTKQYEQVGNAVPPRLAAHVLAEITGLPLSALTVAA